MLAVEKKIVYKQASPWNLGLKIADAAKNSAVVFDFQLNDDDTFSISPSCDDATLYSKVRKKWN